MILFQLIEFLATLIECVVGISFNASLMGNSEIKLKQSILAALLLVVVVLGVNQYQLFSLLTTVIGIVGIAAGASVIYKIKAVDSLIISAGYLVLIHVIDFFSISLLGIALQDENFGGCVIAAYSLNRLAHIVLTKTLLLAIYCLFIRRFMGRIRLPVRKMWIGIILCAAVLYYLGELTFAGVGPHILITWSLQFLMLLIGMYAFIAYRSLVEEQNRASQTAEQAALLAQNYEDLVRRFSSSQIYYHDLKNHNLVLEGYLKTGKYEQAGEYLRQLRQSVNGVEPRTWTGIAVLDFLLACKQAEAKQKKIYFNIFSVPVSLKLTDQELAALFGNALDNAIEACEQLKEGTGWIRVDIRRIQEMVFIKIANSYLTPPRFEEERIVTSKKDLETHGWGMTSLQAVINRNNGSMSFRFDENQFTVVMSFFE